MLAPGRQLPLPLSQVRLLASEMFPNSIPPGPAHASYDRHHSVVYSFGWPLAGVVGIGHHSPSPSPPRISFAHQSLLACGGRLTIPPPVIARGGGVHPAVIAHAYAVFTMAFSPLGFLLPGQVRFELGEGWDWARLGWAGIGLGWAGMGLEGVGWGGEG